MRGFKCDGGRAIDVAELVNLHDVRVREARDPAGLLQEHLAERRLRRAVGQSAFDDDEPLEAVRAALQRQEDFRHAADVEPVHEFVTAHVSALEVGGAVGPLDDEPRTSAWCGSFASGLSRPAGHGARKAAAQVGSAPAPLVPRLHASPVLLSQQRRPEGVVRGTESHASE